MNVMKVIDSSFCEAVYKMYKMYQMNIQNAQYKTDRMTPAFIDL